MRHQPSDFEDYDEAPIPEWLFHSDMSDTYGLGPKN